MPRFSYQVSKVPEGLKEEDVDSEIPTVVASGYMKAASRDRALDRLLAAYGFTDDNLLDTEEGGWGGRPDTYYLATIGVGDHYWGEIHIGFLEPYQEDHEVLLGGTPADIEKTFGDLPGVLGHLEIRKAAER